MGKNSMERKAKTYVGPHRPRNLWSLLSMGLCLCAGVVGTAQAELAYLSGTGITLGIENYWPNDVKVADVNGDGHPDLVSADEQTDSVSVLLGDGSGSFAAPVSFAAGDYPRSVAVADVNEDGYADLVSANYSSNNVSVLLGQGDGAFAAARRACRPGLGACARLPRGAGRPG